MSALSQIFENDEMIKITSEFSRLGERCYLDNAGTILYPKSLLKSVNEDLLNNVYMNPHSDKYTRDCVEQIRCLVLKHFNTDPSNYTVIFTSGTTQSLKLAVEAFQFSADVDDESDIGSFVYLRDNHTSVIGLREIASDKNAEIVHIDHDEFLFSLKSVKESQQINKDGGNTLLVYSAESNFNGYKYPLDCIENIKKGCLNSYIKKYLCKINCNWYVLLDAASYVPNNKLDLSKTQPDFVCLSFCKMFGYPTGLGALLVKNTSSSVLSQKRYFGGGTVDAILSSENYHIKREVFHERFEDGTVPFLSIIALKHCFDTMHKLIPKIIKNDIMETISHHTYYLAKDLYEQLLELKHQNGVPAIKFYMDTKFTNIGKQGGIVTFNVIREDESYIGYAEFQHMADLFNISVRTGCFCNSGSCQRHLIWTNKEMKQMYNAGHKCGDEIDLHNNKPTGAIRISFGYYNSYEDVDRLVQMICHCFIKQKLERPKRLRSYKVSQSLKSHKMSNGNISRSKRITDYVENKVIINIPYVKSEIFLEEIAIFPIKSCGAFKIQSDWKIGPKGFRYDREWMIVKDNGVCLTQKQNSRMCLIRPLIDLKFRVMVLRFKGKSSISIPLDISSCSKTLDTSLCHSKVCTDIVKGYDCGDAVADWISEVLEISFLRLIRQSNEDTRTQKKKSEDEQTLLSLSNQAQFLLINKATVRWLKEKIQDPLFSDDIQQLTDRFRGNLIVEMKQELAEREWQEVIIGKHKFKVEGQCPRCQMVCIDQQTGQKTVEPLRTISEQFGGKLRFGIYLSYIGTLDGEKSSTLQLFSPIVPILFLDGDISR